MFLVESVKDGVSISTLEFIDLIRSEIELKKSN